VLDLLKPASRSSSIHRTVTPSIRQWLKLPERDEPKSPLSLNQQFALDRLMRSPGHGYIVRLPSGDLRVLKTREGRVEEFVLPVRGDVFEGPVVPATRGYENAERAGVPAFLAAVAGGALVGVSALIGDAEDPLGIAGSVVCIIGVLVIFLVSFVQEAETPDPTKGASRSFHGSDETWPVGQWVVWKHSEHSNSD